MASTWIFALTALFINLFAWLFAALLETEVFYDLTGGITFFVIGAFSYWFRAKDALLGEQNRQMWATLMLVSWAVRLSGFLFYRAMLHGDHRLAKYRTDPIKFLIPFSLQAVWCTANALPVLLINASGMDVPIGGLVDTLAIGGWLLGHGIEILADAQKWLFKLNRANRGRFISSGLWGYSRHPNYFGQIVLNWSLMLFCLPAVWAYNSWLTILVCVCAPAVETLLLLYVSGIPPLEKAGQQKWGEDHQYRRYKETVNVLIPWVPKKVPGANKRSF